MAVPFGLMALVAPRLLAQTADTDAAQGAQRAHALVPTASLMQTFTDNGQLTSDATKQSDSITQASVGLRYLSGTGRIRGFVDYSLSGTLRQHGPERQQVNNFLNASLTADVVNNWLYVDASASVSQQSISAFGAQSTDPTLPNANSTEVANFYVAPYVRGSLGGVANYEARLNAATTQSRQTSDSDQTVLGASLDLSGGNRAQGAGWSLGLSRQTIDYKESKKNEIDVARAGLTYAVTSQLLLGVTGGVEANNFTSDEKESHGLYGVNMTWTPSVRTKFTGSYERRFFGNAYSLNFTHRTARTSWAFSSGRDISSGDGRPGFVSLGNAFDLYFNSLASQYPDPALRAQKTLELLRDRGIDPNSQIISPFQTSNITLQQRTQMSFGLLGLRDTLTFFASQSETSRLSQFTAATGSLADTNAVKQYGASADWSHRLTPLSSTGLTFLWQKTEDAEGIQSTMLRSISASWSATLGRHVDVNTGIRFAKSSGTSTYTERAVFGSLRFQF